MISLKRSYSIINIGLQHEFYARPACLVINPITVYSYGLLFIGMPVGQAPHNGDTYIKILIGRSVPDSCLWLGPLFCGILNVIFLLSFFASLSRCRESWYVVCDCCISWSYSLTVL